MLGEALAKYQEIGDERFHARSLGYLGLASLLQNDPGRAGALFAQSLRMFADLTEPSGTAEGLAGLAAVSAAIRHATKAAMLCGAAERLRETAGARELPLERRTTAPYLAESEQALGAGAWARAWAAGRDLPLRNAISLALTGQP